MKFDHYDPQNGPFYDETFAAIGVPRAGFEPLVNGINALDEGSLLARQAAAKGIERPRVRLVKARNVRRVVRAEWIDCREIVEQLGPLYGVGVAQTEQRVSGAELGQQIQRSIVEPNRSGAKSGQELARAQAEIVMLHDRLGENCFAAAARFESVCEVGPALLHFFTAPAALPATMLGDQPVALKVVQHTAHVEDEHAGHRRPVLAEIARRAQ